MALNAYIRKRSLLNHVSFHFRLLRKEKIQYKESRNKDIVKRNGDKQKINKVLSFEQINKIDKHLIIYIHVYHTFRERGKNN